MRTEKRLVLAVAFVLLAAAAAPCAMAEPTPAPNPSFISVLCDWLQVFFGGPPPQDPPGETPSFVGFTIPGG